VDPGIPVFPGMIVAGFMAVGVMVKMIVKMIGGIFVAVGMACRLILAVSVVLIPGVVIGPVSQVHHRAEPPDGPPGSPGKIEGRGPKAQFAQFGPEDVRIRPQIHQGAQAHIPGDPGVTVKMQGPQSVLPPQTARARFRLPMA
jgi:hypothetical protein